MCIMNSLLYVPFHSVGLFFISLIVLSFITYYSTPAPFSYGTVSMLQKCVISQVGLRSAIGQHTHYRLR